MKQNRITRRAFARSSIALTALALSPFVTVSVAEQTILKPDGKPADQKKKVNVFILMGQSNMVGMGDIQGGNSSWKTALQKPVLVLKSCIGNRGLGWDLLPPGSQRFEEGGKVYASHYEQNLVNLIKSLRKDYDAPNAKFVLATGCGNPGRESFGLQIAEAQLAIADSKKHSEFAGNVKAVDSRGFWREVAVSPKDQGYHYNRNAETYMEVGLALGRAMAELLKK